MPYRLLLNKRVSVVKIAKHILLTDLSDHDGQRRLSTWYTPDLGLRILMPRTFPLIADMTLCSTSKRWLWGIGQRIPRERRCGTLMC